MSRSLTSRNGAFRRSELLNGIVPNVEKLAPRVLFLFAPDLGHRAQARRDPSVVGNDLAPPRSVEAQTLGQLLLVPFESSELLIAWLMLQIAVDTLAIMFFIA
jgi:hypothetical protein